MKTIKIFAVVVFTTVLSGCGTMPCQFVPSSVPVEGRQYKILTNKRVIGHSNHLRVFGLGGSGRSTYSKAYEMALGNTGCERADGLLQMTVEVYVRGIPPLIFGDGVLVTGVPFVFTDGMTTSQIEME